MENFVFMATDTHSDQLKGDPPDHSGMVSGESEKKGGNERRKGLGNEKFKEKQGQSLPIDVSQTGLQTHDKVTMGSPHLLAFPANHSQINSSRGFNEKKRALKDLLHVTLSNESGGIRKPKEKVTSMHKSLIKDVRLGSESTRKEANSLSQLGVKPISSGNSLGQGETSTTKPAITKGFDLGTGIVISPGLLNGAVTLGRAGKGVKGKPPDSSLKSSSLGSKSDGVLKGGGMKNDLVDHATNAVSGMILDSDQ
ncbi:hypothetical protein RIF29_13892 [Crotalaria pallida]|uniref:Uncharacterized protein n=1 Tax=Crotalaria pallida TaxID=3830 RepID=A0AAN9FAF2_CROPI